LWSPADPFLYDLVLELLGADGSVLDTVTSYGGLRSVGIDGKAVLLNGKPVFQRLVLDQGFYRDGILTAPSDAALVRDIELSMAAGFNGARLHQKVFEERFLFHADRLGYLVWGEFGDWGSNVGGHHSDNQQPTASYITQWLEAVERDYSHPAIVGWCPLNETHQDLHDRITQLDDVTTGMFLATKAIDSTRPVLDASGYSHRVRETDVWDSHNYEQDPAAFAAVMAPLADGMPYENGRDQGETGWSTPYAGQPYFCSEFGGIWWQPGARDDRSVVVGLRAASGVAGGVLHTLRGPGCGAAGRPADVRLLLHAADRRVPGAERDLHVRPLREGRDGADPLSTVEEGSDRGLTPPASTAAWRDVRLQNNRVPSLADAVLLQSHARRRHRARISAPNRSACTNTSRSVAIRTTQPSSSRLCRRAMSFSHWRRSSKWCRPSYSIAMRRSG